LGREKWKGVIGGFLENQEGSTNSAGFTYRLDRLKLRAFKFRGPTAGADPGFQVRGVRSQFEVRYR
jgi:hypothetical protein